MEQESQPSNHFTQLDVYQISLRFLIQNYSTVLLFSNDSIISFVNIQKKINKSLQLGPKDDDHP